MFLGARIVCIKCMDSEVDWLKLQSYHELAVWPLESHITFLCLSSLSIKYGYWNFPTGMMKQDSAQEAYGMVLSSLSIFMPWPVL